MAFDVSDIIIFVDAEADLPTTHNAAAGGTTGRLAYADDTKKMFIDDGTFWVDILLTGNIGLPSSALLLRINSLYAPSANWSNNNKKITDVLDPTLAQDAATKKYVDDGLSATASGVLSTAAGYASGAQAAAQGYTDAREALIRSDIADDIAAIDTGGGGSGALFSLVFTEDGEVVLLEDGTLATVRL